MDPIFYYDGKLFRGDEAAVSFRDRAIFFGDAVYDACLVRGGTPYLLDRHIDRFFDGLTALSMSPPMERNALSYLLSALCKRAECEVAFLYFQASRCAETRRHFFTEGDGSRLTVTLSEIPKPDESATLRLILEKDRRYEYCNVKTTNLLPAVLASAKAKKQGADEAVFIRNGFVTECAHSNISILKNGTLLTHPTDAHILPGIARERLINACRTLHIPVCERPFRAKELMDADEILVTSTTKICARAAAVASKAAGMKDARRAKEITDVLFSDFCKK
ncbi:MAG: aminotransferase class IV [Clostridia bacterium]|nr:aminotransferase class IV [Clostridia bacterium]